MVSTIPKDVSYRLPNFCLSRLLLFYLKSGHFLTQYLMLSLLRLACISQNTFPRVCLTQVLFETVLACSSNGVNGIPSSLLFLLRKCHPNILGVVGNIHFETKGKSVSLLHLHLLDFTWTVSLPRS